MNYLVVLASTLALLAVDVDAAAKGGFSSGGGGRSSGSFSSGRSVSSSPSVAPRPAPAPTPSVAPTAAPKPSVAPAAPPPTGPNGGKGSFSSAQPPKPTPGAAPATRTVTTSTTTSVSTHSYSGRNVSPGGMYGGWGMGYGYSNGLLTGLIIGNMMHPHGSIMYAGPGVYANNALLYPNGQVVNQQGVLVGTYVNGVFSPVTNGQVVAQAVPQDVQATPIAQPQPVQIVKAEPSFVEIFTMVLLSVFCVILIFAIIL